MSNDTQTSERGTMLPWLDNLPSHWGIQRGKTLFQKMKRPICEHDEVVTAFRDGQVTLRKNRRLEGFTEAIQEHGYQGIRVGDLVIHSMDAFAGAIGVSDSDGKASPVYQVCRPLSDDVNPHYFAWLIRQMSKSGFILALAKGIRERSTDFRFSDFAEQYYPVPPLAEQRAIVDFLDRKLEQIDRFIANKRRMIELLQEQLENEILRLVAGGIQGSKLIDSGFSWLPRIPLGWSMRRNATLFSERKHRGRLELPILTVSIRHGVTLERPSEVREQRQIEDKEKYSFAAKGDLVYNMMRMWQGAVGVVPVDGNVSPAYVVITPRPDVVPEYYELLFRTKIYQGEVLCYSYGIVSDRNRLYWDNFKSIYSPFPPKNEQQEIVNAVSSMQRRTSSTISKIEREIDLITEFRTALVAEAVTGKIDVQRAM